MRGKLISFALVALMFLFAFMGKNAQAATTLPDIKGHWAQSEIEMLLKQKIVEGRLDSNGQIKFYPEANITRAEFIVMLVNALPNIQPKSDTTYFSYKDTHKHWAEPFIEAATEASITGGVGDGMFMPNQPITRYEIAVMLVRAKKLNLVKGKDKPFADVGQDLWFYKSLLIARSNGTISGDSDNKFRPFANSTRAETAAMIARILYQ